MEDVSNELVEEAARVATAAHYGQLRRDTLEPYINHPKEVAELSASLGLPNWAVCVAWLHDTIEDCGLTHKGLAFQFGPLIADGVLVLSNVNVWTRAERKRQECIRLSAQHPHIQTIKILDRTTNLRDIAKTDPKFFPRYRTETIQLLGALQQADPRAVAMLRSVFQTI